jgi:hypothetical protein
MYAVFGENPAFRRLVSIVSPFSWFGSRAKRRVWAQKTAFATQEAGKQV